MKKYVCYLAVMLLFTACSRDDNPAWEVNDDNVTGSWICEYAEEGYTWLDDPYDYVVQYYRFHDDGTGFYEIYYFKDKEMILMDYGRDWYEDFIYSAKGGQVKLTYELDEVSWSLTYLKGQLIDQQGHPFVPSTEEQDELVLLWFTSQHIAGDEGKEITYIERSWDGEKVVDKEVTAEAQCLNDIQVGAGYVRALSGTWYVTGEHKIQGFLKVEQGQTLDIILCDNCELSLPSIRVEGGTFRLFGQSQELGVLLVGNVPGYSDLNEGAAIGAHQVSGGTVEIHSGNIMAFGGDSGAGIGGFMYATISSVKIYGGGHYIEGGRGAAGIGAPPFAMRQAGKIEIFGGILTAVGGMPNSGKNIGGGAGIGGGAVLPVESVIIYGGDITAEARDYAAGIGTGQFYGLDHSRIHPSDEQLDVLKTSVIIKGGKVEAKGGCKGAGIGGGRYMAPGKIEISGGEVHAFGADGAGIGGGGDANPVEINISGGYVEAHGNNVLHPNNSYYDSASAGIGGGCNGRGGKITISGGEVHAYGGDNGAGIGGGNKGNSGDITISGGLVEAVGGTYGAGIGAGSWGMMDIITITTENGPVYVSGRAGNDCGLWAGSIGTYLELNRDGGTLNIGNGVKVIGITDFDNGVNWADIPVASNPARWIYGRCHVQLKTCDHPGYTAETCIYCKHE